jgi:electron transfer flavoprotein alpha subunit
MNEEIIIIAEHREGKINPVTFELVSFAEELQKETAGNIKIILIGKNIAGAAADISIATGVHVTGIENRDASSYSSEAYVGVLAGFLSSRNVGYICVPHTSTGFEYAPALAVKLGVSCISGIDNLNTEKNEISFTRSVINGKIEMKISPSFPSAVLTILPGSFKAKDRTGISYEGLFEIIKSDFAIQKTKTLGIIEAAKDDYPIVEAEVIVSAGRGIGKKENLELIYSLAGIFSKAAIGASRPICDLGWLEYGHQVGTTGKNVSPKLYIACGVSGTVQHLSGMKGSKLVVAINTDPNAAIFNYADFCIVEDITTFIPALIEEYNRRRSAL